MAKTPLLSKKKQDHALSCANVPCLLSQPTSLRVTRAKRHHTSSLLKWECQAFDYLNQQSHLIKKHNVFKPRKDTIFLLIKNLTNYAFLILRLACCSVQQPEKLLKDRTQLGWPELRAIPVPLHQHAVILNNNNNYKGFL